MKMKKNQETVSPNFWLVVHVHKQIETHMLQLSVSPQGLRKWLICARENSFVRNLSHLEREIQACHFLFFFLLTSGQLLHSLDGRFQRVRHSLQCQGGVEQSRFQRLFDDPTCTLSQAHVFCYCLCVTFVFHVPHVWYQTNEARLPSQETITEAN